jgi:hypothetical protein
VSTTGRFAAIGGAPGSLARSLPLEAGELVGLGSMGVAGARGQPNHASVEPQIKAWNHEGRVMPRSIDRRTQVFQSYQDFQSSCLLHSASMVLSSSDAYQHSRDWHALRGGERAGVCRLFQQ